MKRMLHLDAPAKVNLVLRILRKRKDGYHEIKTVFQKISLADTLHFGLTKEPGIAITTNHANLPTGEENLVYRAARMILDGADYRGGLWVRIHKRIPLGAGLGGGSSDAATTLRAGSELLGLRLTQKDMARMGAKLGADVPFFFMKGAALGSGIGDRLRPIELPEFWYVLINPGFEVSTAWAYRAVRLTKKPFHYSFNKFATSLRGIGRILQNDQEDGVSRVHPEIGTIKDLLLSAGAEGALMSGSGPTVFGIFQGEGGVEKAYRRIKKMVQGKGWIVLKAHGLAG